MTRQLLRAAAALRGALCMPHSRAARARKANAHKYINNRTSAASLAPSSIRALRYRTEQRTLRINTPTGPTPHAAPSRST
jgi:hypothetical protein